MMRRILAAKWFIGAAIILVALLLSGYFYTAQKCGGVGGAVPMPAIVDYNYHIRPILSDNCFACHGPDQNAREADLRLDTEEGAYKALVETAGMHAIVPGHPDRTEEHTSEHPSLMRIWYSVFCLNNQTDKPKTTH